jgi:hypothetical protein
MLQGTLQLDIDVLVAVLQKVQVVGCYAASTAKWSSPFQRIVFWVWLIGPEDENTHSP